VSVALDGLRVSLRRAAGDVPLVQDVSFRIEPGRVLGLVGESGAGKSLTAAALIGLVAPPVQITAGQLSLRGREVRLESAEAVRPLRGKEVGFVPQDPFTSLDPLFRVGEQLVETLRAHLPLDRAAARERAIRLLTDVGLPSPAERFEHYPHQLSGGMRQRVAIALALGAEPPLVVADECTTALDVSTQAQIVSLLARLVEEHGTSVLLITHDLGVVAELATEVAIMYAGRIVERAPVGRLLRAPRHPYTRALLDAVPRIGGMGAGALPAIPGAMPRPGELPPGCAFHPRCPRASERCRAERPPLESTDEGELACWNPLEPGGSGG
jgi:peptide/nickel transport system ATP-binding protein